MHTINAIVTTIPNSIMKVAKGCRPYLSPVPPELLTPNSPPNYARNTSNPAQAPVSQTECSNSIQHDQEVQTWQKAPFYWCRWSAVNVPGSPSRHRALWLRGDVHSAQQPCCRAPQALRLHTTTVKCHPRALHTHSPTIHLLYYLIFWC